MAIISNLVARFTAESTAFERGTQRARKSLYGLQSDSLKTQRAFLNLTRGVLGFIGVGAGIYGVKRAMTSIIVAAKEQEKAENQLAAALKMTDADYAVRLETLKKYAASLQKLTIYGDEQILSQMAYAKNLGVTTEQLDEAAKAAIGLAAKFRLDLASAMMLVGRASQGQTQMLTRYGIVIDQTLSSQEKFNRLLQIGSENFSLAIEQTKDMEGITAQLSNTWGDFKEKLGQTFTPSIIDAMKFMTQSLQMWNEEIDWSKRKTEAAAKALEAYRSATGDVKALTTPPPTGAWAPTMPIKPQYPEIYQQFYNQALAGFEPGLHPPSYWENRAKEPIKEAIKNIQEELKTFPGPLPGTEGAMETTLGQADELIAKMRRENELAVMTGEERARALAIDKYRQAVLKDIEGGMQRSREITIAERQAVEDLAIEQYRLSNQQIDSTVDVAAAYVRMYNEIDDHSAESYQWRKRLIEAELEAYRQTINDEVLLAKWKNEQLIKLRLEEPQTISEGIAGGIEQFRRELGTLPQLIDKITKDSLAGMTDAITDAVFEAKDLSDAMRDIARSIGKELMRFGIGNALAGISGALFPMPIMHSGGIAGQTSFPKRLISPSIFAGAPRLHGGLRQDEFPAILQVGEKVVSRAETARGNVSVSAGIESRLDMLIALMERRQTINAKIVDHRDVVTAGQIEGRQGQQWVMNHVERNGR